MVIAGGEDGATGTLSIWVASTEPAMVIAGGRSMRALRGRPLQALQRSRRW